MKIYVQKMHKGHAPDFSRDQQGTLRFRGRICAPNLEGLKKKILVEAHEAPYSIHPGGTKMMKTFVRYFGGME